MSLCRNEVPFGSMNGLHDSNIPYAICYVSNTVLIIPVCVDLSYNYTLIKGDIGPTGPMGPIARGTVYTRWGKTICPQDKRTQLLYSGRTAGTHYTQSGRGANYLCLPDNPEYLATETVSHNSHIHCFQTIHVNGSSRPFLHRYCYNMPDNGILYLIYQQIKI